MGKITEMTQEGEIDSPWVSPIGQFTDDALAEDLAEDEEFRRIWEETATERHIAHGKWTLSHQSRDPEANRRRAWPKPDDNVRAEG